MEMKSKIVARDIIAQRAERLLEKWGPCPCVPDGEDSSGRQKVRAMSASEVAARAVDLAEALDLRLYVTGHQTDET